ncbi:SAF domain-containing protein [Vibrio nigripulchritudo ATCC 27043]|uniref:UxaA family hydrolase n=1 Tax=Vibrio nigripulchritudo TaxID=28173 RepID=UPI00021C30DE|nr:UxaA family hydrolase [Vibrio nigripulchritudo]EGU60910.1 SAF domain-containing protein [Vibrio nigripulchritudo ATCC 27043]
MSETHFLVHDVNDTVGVMVVENVVKGMEVTGYMMDTDEEIRLRALADIPLGHKIALRDLSVGDTIIKYNEDMGKVVEAVAAGGHAHVHNIKTKRW